MKHSLSLVGRIMADILDETEQKISIKQLQRIMPDYILKTVNNGLTQVNQYMIRQKISNQQQHKQITMINQIDDHEHLRIDNRAPNECKRYQNKSNNSINKTPRLRLKNTSKYTKSISVKSQNNLSVLSQQYIHQTRLNSNQKNAFNNSNNYIQPKSANLNNNKLSANNQFNAHNMNKKPNRSIKTQKNFIKLYTQSSQQLLDYQQQQKLRLQLLNKRQQLQKFRQSQLHNQNNNKHKTNKSINSLNDFTFHYDSTILKSNNKLNQKYIQSINNNLKYPSQTPYQQISQLASMVTKPSIRRKKKSITNQISMPQIISNLSKVNISKLSTQKPKSYRQQILLNTQRSKSVIQIVKNNNQMKSRGILIKQVIDGKMQQFKKDSIDIIKNIQQLNKKQFYSQISHKKFISRIKNNSNKVLDNSQEIH